MIGEHWQSQATAITLALGCLSLVQFVDIVVCEQTKHFNLQSSLMQFISYYLPKCNFINCSKNKYNSWTKQLLNQTLSGFELMNLWLHKSGVSTTQSLRHPVHYILLTQTMKSPINYLYYLSYILHIMSGFVSSYVVLLYPRSIPGIWQTLMF